MSKMRKNISSTVVIIILVVLIALNFYQLPYYITQPGSANDVNTMVHVKGSKKEPGHFMLVTILVGKANIYQFISSKFRKYEEILPAVEVQEPDENTKEYDLRQLNYMDDAQKTATYIAYKEAGKNPKIDYHGVLILNVISSMPSNKVLKAGDVITAVNGHPVKRVTDVQKQVKGKKLHDHITVTVLRGGQQKTVTVEIGKFPKKDIIPGGPKFGIGIVQSPDYDVSVTPKVKFDTGSIGGPSAGLMMTLEIYEELTQKNMRHGYDIAGTGTISMNGKVGPIGGISQKVVAANNAGANYFFAPVSQGEAKQAEKTAKDIGTKMKIIPVKSFQDAVDFLNTLK